MKLNSKLLKDKTDLETLKEVDMNNTNINYAKSGIKIKKKNRGKFTEYCGGTVTQECINRAKRSGSKTLKKRAVFAENARHFKHKDGGILEAQSGTKMIKAGELAKQHLTKSKNPDWQSFDTGYNLLRQKGLDHNSAIAIMGNVMQESAGRYDAKQIGGGGGKGLVQWTGKKPPIGLNNQWTALYESAAKPANVYNKKTKTSDNYWKTVNGVNGTDLQKKFNSKGTSTKEKTRIYAQAYLRPGKPELDKRFLYSAQLDSIYGDIRNKLVKVR